jgi:hypothetical protein
MKKVLGAIMVVVGFIFGMGFLVQLPKSLSRLGTILAEEGSGAAALGRLTGMILFDILLVVIAYLLIRYGIKLIKSRPA